jgi:Na+/proline symporter
VILIYALLGGFWAVSLTDTLQGAMMAVISVLLPLLALIAAGGIDGSWTTLSRPCPPPISIPWADAACSPLSALRPGIASIGLGALGQPHLLARLMAVKDDSGPQAQGFAIAIGWGVIVHIAGMARSWRCPGRALVMDAADGEALFYQIAAMVLPAVLAGIVIAAVCLR